MPSWTVSIAPRALKAVRRAPRHERELLRRALDNLAENPSAGDVVPLKNERASFRRRAGDWRIFFDLYPTDHLVEVVDIARRTTTTYRKRRS